MTIKASSGQVKELGEILKMPSGPQKKFWLLAVIAQVNGTDASIAAREFSCDEILDKFGWIITSLRSGTTVNEH